MVLIYRSINCNWFFSSLRQLRIADFTLCNGSGNFDNKGAAGVPSSDRLIKVEGICGSNQSNKIWISLSKSEVLFDKSARFGKGMMDDIRSFVISTCMISGCPAVE